MFYKLFSDKDVKQMEALKKSHGGAKVINETVAKMRDYKLRKKIAGNKGFGPMLEQAEKYAMTFPKVEDYIKKNKLKLNKKGEAITQVSGFQGAPVTLQCMKKLSECGTTLVPTEMISVMALDEDYVYNGELLTTLAMCENIMGASRFCNTNLLTTPLPTKRFKHIEKVTGEKFVTAKGDNGTLRLVMNNMGTAFGNLGGVEVGNNNHLVYLDNVTRCAMATGGNFYLNPSWSTIAAVACYFRDIPNVSFKISMLLSTQNCIQFRLILNILRSYLRANKTSPVTEINIGNAATAETFIQCSNELKKSGIKGISLTAHLRINPDLGRVDFNWFDEAVKVLKSGTDMTIKYESDGESREFDTMAAYFMNKDDRFANAKKIGDVLFYKCLRCDKDAKAIMKMGHPAVFARISHK